MAELAEVKHGYVAHPLRFLQKVLCDGATVPVDETVELALEEPYRTMVIIAMCLGLRVSEILALKWPDFDFEEGTLMITRAPFMEESGA